MNPAEKTLLVNVISDWARRVIDVQARIEAFENLLESQRPAVYAKYVADVQQIKKRPSGGRDLEELEAIRRNLAHD